MSRFCALALAVLVLTTPAAAREGELPLAQQVGQLIVLSFKGTAAPPYVLAALRERRAAGVILFGGNVESPRQLRALTSALRKAGGSPLVAVDQEGGDVRVVPWAPPRSSAPEQAGMGSVGRDAGAAGNALRRLGINVSLAPVVDVPSVAGSAMASRSFSDDPKRTSQAAAASVAGWRAGGVAPTAKHFPGLGAATANTDDRPVTIWHSPKQLMTIDLPTFAAAIQAGVPLVMVSHARYPAFDRRRIASQSRPIIEGLLRDGLGFRGAVVTDSMEAAASLATGSITATSERAVRAGADLVLLTGRSSYRPVYAHLLARARSSLSFRKRVHEAAARVLALKGA